MKKIIYLSIALMFSVTILSAKNIEEVNLNTKLVKIEKIEEVSEEGTVMFVRYRGRCLDGHTFTFSAGNLEIAQEFVNSYCAARDTFEVEEE